MGYPPGTRNRKTLKRRAGRKARRECQSRVDMSSTLLRTRAERRNGFLLWFRMDADASYYALLAPGAPGWHRTIARET
eukprot:1788478-Alexandrium_andersonii.AAC.1